MSLMNPMHVVISLDNEKELDVALARNHNFFIGINFKKFRWRLGFSTEVDPSVVPVWVDIP